MRHRLSRNCAKVPVASFGVFEQQLFCELGLGKSHAKRIATRTTICSPQTLQALQVQQEVGLHVCPGE
jgi:hypothetical protein